MTAPAEDYEQMSYYEENYYDNISFNDFTSYDDQSSWLCDSDIVDQVNQFLSHYVHPIIIVLGFFGNLLVIITYALYKKTRSMTDVYLLNVAVADALLVLALPLITYNEQHNWVMGDGACKFLSGAYSLNLYSGLLLLACISVDRYLAIVFAGRTQYLRSQMRLYSHAICTVVWVMALLISLPTFMYTTTDQPSFDIMMLNNTLEPNGKFSMLYFDSTERAGLRDILIPSLQMALGFLLPLMLMTFCYTCIIVTLLKTCNIQRQKAVRVVLMVVLVFIICHLPYSITLLVYTITLREQMECSSVITILVGLDITRTLGYLHCCLNPILFAYMGIQFRIDFQRVLQGLWCRRKDDLS